MTRFVELLSTEGVRTYINLDHVVAVIDIPEDRSVVVADNGDSSSITVAIPAGQLITDIREGRRVINVG